MADALFTAPTKSTPYRRWTPRGVVDAPEAKGLRVAGFEASRLFTARDLGNDGVLHYRAFEGHYGVGISEHHLHRNLAETEARRNLRGLSLKEFEGRLAAHVARRVESREAASVAGQVGRPPGESLVPGPAKGSSVGVDAIVRGPT